MSLQSLTEEKAADMRPVVEKGKGADEDQDKAQAANFAELPVGPLNNLPRLEEFHQKNTEQAVYRRIAARCHVKWRKNSGNHIPTYSADKVDDCDTQRSRLAVGVGMRVRLGFSVVGVSWFRV